MDTTRVNEVLGKLQSLGSNSDQAWSATAIGYSYKYLENSPLFDGTLYYEDSRQRPVKFMKFENEEINDVEYMFKQTLKLNEVPGVAKVLFHTESKQKKMKLLCYENFTPLTTWIKANIDKRPFDGLQGHEYDPLHPWWRKNLRDMLGTIKSMHKLGVYHDRLEEKDAYVVDSSGALKLIMVDGFFDRQYDVSVEKYKVEQLRDFKSVLESSFLIHDLSDSQKEERNKFLSCFDMHNKPPLHLTYDELVKKLSTHPFLLDPCQKIEYGFKVYEAIKQGKIHQLHTLESQLVDPKSCFGKYANWRCGIPLDGALERIFNFKNMRYNSDAMDLLRFLRNLSHDVPDKEIKQLDRRIARDICPGFLSDLHKRYIFNADKN